MPSGQICVFLPVGWSRLPPGAQRRGDRRSLDPLALVVEYWGRPEPAPDALSGDEMTRCILEPKAAPVYKAR